jgi:uncharacterized membrane protein YgcG
MNGRTALGAGLILFAVLAGALFLDRSQQLVPVYAAARDLPSGTQLRNGDLSVVRVRLPATALRHYLRPSPGHQIAGRVLISPVRRETLVPAGVVLASDREADLVELPVQVDQGDMAHGLRPGDSVQVLAAYTEGARRGRAVVLLPTAEVVQVLEDAAGLGATGQERGVQLRMPSDRAPIVAAAIATARIFVVKAPGRPIDPGTLDPTGSDPAGGDPAGTDPAPLDPAGSDPAGLDPAGADSAGGDPAGGETTDPAWPGAPPLAPEPTYPGSSATGSSGAGSSGARSSGIGSGGAGSGGSGSGGAGSGVTGRVRETRAATVTTGSG